MPGSQFILPPSGCPLDGWSYLRWLSPPDRFTPLSPSSRHLAATPSPQPGQDKGRQRPSSSMELISAFPGHSSWLTLALFQCVYICLRPRGPKQTPNAFQITTELSHPERASDGPSLVSPFHIKQRVGEGELPCSLGNCAADQLQATIGTHVWVPAP